MTDGRRDWILRLSALLAGLAAALAHPPFGLLPALLGYAGLLAVLDRPGARPLRSGFFRGWLAGIGYFVVSVWWIVEPFMVDAANQGWMAPFALLFMASGLALFWGLAGLAYRAIAPQGLSRVLIFAGLLALAEWLRGHIFTGFPWNLPGETWRAGSAPSQMAALIGVYGLGWLTIAVAAAPAVLFDRDRSWLARGMTFAIALAALGCIYAFGLGRLAYALPTPADAPVVRVVQANIDQKEKWRPENLDGIFSAYAELTRRPGAPAVVIWPEGALPAIIDDLLSPQSPYGPRLRDAVAPGQTLIMGANRVEVNQPNDVRYFNSLVAFRREGEGVRITGIYDKHRLVPFGEFLPFGDLATAIGLRSLVHMPEDFTPGAKPEPLTPWGLPAVQPMICYEALFPGFTRAAAARADLRPAWILNASNDAWFGRTSGPLQHLNIASYRAIEEGLPIVRSTPTGVSAVIDAYGRADAAARLETGVYGVLDRQLPAALAPTPYSRMGDWAFWMLIALSAMVALGERIQRPRLDDASIAHSA